MKFARMIALLLVAALTIITVGSPAQHTSADGGGGGGRRTPTPTPTPTQAIPPGPPAPTPLAPANGASVVIPFTISWSAVSDPSGIIAYNWQVSPSSSFSSVVASNSTGGQTQAVVSGLATGTYFWRVQAVNGNFVQGAWSSARSFTVTGAGAGAPGSPVLNPPHGASAFHPMEVIYFDWSAVPGAVTYNFDASNDPNFPVASRVHFDNISGTTYSLQLGDSMPQGTWYVRVTAMNAESIAGIPSNVVTFTLSFNAPLPPPPTPLSPADGASVTLPVTLTWTDVPNPQPSGYVLEVAADPGFSNIQYVNNQITGAHWTISSLPAGTKYWHVLSTQGDSAPAVPANTAWSSTRSFIVPSTPPVVASLAVATDPASTGQTQVVSVQLTGPAPAGGAVVSLSSSDPALVSLPASVTVAPGDYSVSLNAPTSAVTTPTVVTISATLNGGTLRSQVTLTPQQAPASLTLDPVVASAPAGSSGTVRLGSAAVYDTLLYLSSSNPAVARVNSAVIVPQGSLTGGFIVSVPVLTTTTTVTITVSGAGVTRTAMLTVQPPGGTTPTPTPIPIPTSTPTSTPVVPTATATPTLVAGDNVTITRAEYSTGSRELRVEATSTSANAVLRVYVTSTNELIGTLSNDGGGRYRGQFTWPTNPQNITVRSSLGGSASRSVLAN